MAVRAAGGKVIAQVKKVVPTGSLSADDIYIPGIYVDAVYQCTDAQQHHQTIGGVDGYDASLLGHKNVMLEEKQMVPLHAKKVIARRCAMELLPRDVVNLGIGTPEFLAAVAAEEGVYSRITLTAESGVIGGIPCSGEAFGAAKNPICLLDQPSQFDFYDGGGLDASFLGFAQADACGNVNISRFGNKVYGCGGSINISQNTKKLIFCGTFTAGGLRQKVFDGAMHILREGKNKKFVKKIEQITYNGMQGAAMGQEVLYITERAVFGLEEGGITLREYAPGVDIKKDILAQMEFEPKISNDLKQMNKELFLEPCLGLRTLWENRL